VGVTLQPIPIALHALRSEAGETMVLRDNFFIEKILPSAVLRELSDEEMAENRRPFAEPVGILAGGAVLDRARSFPAQTEVTVAGIHFVQEDSPDEIGRAIADWSGRS
jgi:haloalkane dehalogenase